MFKGPLSSTNAVVRKVSHDVWWYIFILFYRESSNNTLEIIRLSHVCSLWRAIISDTSELWTHIELKVYLAHENPHTVPKLELLSRMLRNSRDKPLNMSLRRIRPREDTVQVARMLDFSSVRMFLGAMDRARELGLDFTVLAALFRFETRHLEDAQTIIPSGRLLEKLVVDASLSSAGVVPLISQLWTPAPLLHALQFYGAEADEADVRALQLSHFPFQQLTTLEFETSIDLHLAFRFLHQVPSLVVLTFDLIYGDLDEDPPSEVIILPELQTFVLTGLSLTDDEDATPRPMMELLDYLALPSLTTLRFNLSREWSLGSFLSFIRRSDSPCIKHFHLEIVGASEIDKLECLKVLPDLQTLDLRIEHSMSVDGDSDYYGDTLCSALREWDSSLGAFVICPNLEQLLMDYGALKDTSTTVFADMIEDRWRRSQTGKNFQLVLRGAPDANDSGADKANTTELKRLLVLNQLGLSVLFEDAPWWLEKQVYIRGTNGLGDSRVVRNEN